MKNKPCLKGMSPAIGKSSIQERLAESARSKKKQACRFLGTEEPAPQPKLARYAQELDWALADLRSGELTPEIATARGAFFSRSLAKERMRLAAPVPAARAEMELLEGRLVEFATEMDGEDKAQLRAAWTSGVEGAKGGVSKLGLHGYWMAQALLRDDAAELDALWAAGGAFGLLRTLKFEPMALAISWGAKRCAGTIARAGISAKIELETKKRAYDAMMAQGGAGALGKSMWALGGAGALSSSMWEKALGIMSSGPGFYLRSFDDMAAGDNRYLGWVSRRHLLSASKDGADLDPSSAFGALSQSFSSDIVHGAWSQRADALMEESEALAAWISVAVPEEAAALEAWQIQQALGPFAEAQSASSSTAPRKLRI